MNRRFKSLLKWSALVLVLLLLVALAAGIFFVRKPWPQVDGTLQIAGLEGAVEVIRDRWGVPHIYAENEHDLFLAQGYVHAQDRLWQMEFNRHASHGTLSEILGPPLLEADRFLRTVGMSRAAASDWDALPPEAKAMLEAYAKGVNAFLDSHSGADLPLEFTLLGVEPKPWTPMDSLAWSKLMGLTLSLNHPMEVLREHLAEKVGEDAMAQLLEPYPSDAPVIVEQSAPSADEEEALESTTIATLVDGAGQGRNHPILQAMLGQPGTFWGSNSWIIHGSRTQSGKPILANDTHLGLGMPSIWYEVGLHGGRFNSAGFSFPGMPLVVIGQNSRIAWGITNMCTDVQDFFVERLDDPENPKQYEFAGSWHDLEFVTEVIAQKGAESVEVQIPHTHHGPLMNAVMPELAESEPMALSWHALEKSRLVEALRQLNLSEDWQTFQDALSLWDTPSLNVSYADIDGNIGYQSTGKTPIRVPGHDGTRPVPGWTGDHEWQGSIPWEAMPRAFNPPSGFIVTANNKVVDDTYPYFLAVDMADGYRAERISQVLSAQSNITVEDVIRLQADVLSLPAANLVPHLQAVQPKDERQSGALATVLDWDLQLDADSAGAALYEVWFYFLWSEIFNDELGDELMTFYRSRSVSQVPLMIGLLASESPWFDDITTEAIETREDIVHRSFTKAVDWLEEHFGAPEQWAWGDVHAITFGHIPFGQSGIAPLEKIFNSKTFPLGGNVFSVNSSMSNLEAPFEANFGVSQRYIADLANLKHSVAVNSTGQVAHAFHPHREDQSELWNGVQFHPVITERQDAEKEAKASLRLLPE